MRNADDLLDAAAEKLPAMLEARKAGAVLVCEPAADGGAVKIGRKGLAAYRVAVTGRAAHAGLEPELGVNAGVELAHQILAIPRTPRWCRRSSPGVPR